MSPLRAALVAGLALVLVLAGLRVSTVAYLRSCAEGYPHQEFVTVDGVRLHDASAGDGVAVVLLHGDGGSLLDCTMSPSFERLAEHYHVVAFDRPGHGYSDATGQAATLRGQARLIRGAVRALGLDDPVLVGHSRGASVVAAYLDVYPGEVAAAAPVGGALLADGQSPVSWFYRLGAWPVVGRLLTAAVYAPAVRFGDHALVRDSLDRAFAPEGPAPGAYVTAYACQWVQPGAVRTTHRLAQDTDRALPAISQGYPDLQVPLVIVHGDADGNVDPADAARVHETVEVSVLRLPAGAGHEPRFTRADEVAAVGDALALRSDAVPADARQERP